MFAHNIPETQAEMKRSNSFLPQSFCLLHTCTFAICRAPFSLLPHNSGTAVLFRAEFYNSMYLKKQNQPKLQIKNPFLMQRCQVWEAAEGRWVSLPHSISGLLAVGDKHCLLNPSLHPKNNPHHIYPYLCARIQQKPDEAGCKQAANLTF